MSRLFPTMILIWPALVVAAPIQSSDDLFLYGQLICWHDIGVIEGVTISSTGEATFLGSVSLEVVGKEPSEVTSMLASALEKQTGKRPTTLKLRAIPESNAKESALLLLAIASSKPEARTCGPSPLRDLPTGKAVFYEPIAATYNLPLKVTSGTLRALGTLALC